MHLKLSSVHQYIILQTLKVCQKLLYCKFSQNTHYYNIAITYFIKMLLGADGHKGQFFSTPDNKFYYNVSDVSFLFYNYTASF